MKRIAKLITALAVVLTVLLGVNLEQASQASAYSGNATVVVYNPSDNNASWCTYYIWYWDYHSDTPIGEGLRQNCGAWTAAYMQVLVQYDQWPWAVVSDWWQGGYTEAIGPAGVGADATGVCVRAQWAYNTTPSNWSCISYWT